MLCSALRYLVEFSFVSPVDSDGRCSLTFSAPCPLRENSKVWFGRKLRSGFVHLVDDAAARGRTRTEPKTLEFPKISTYHAFVSRLPGHPSYGKLLPLAFVQS